MQPGSETTRFPNNLPPQWKNHLAQEGEKEYFTQLSSFLRSEYRGGQKIFPSQDCILRALQEVDYDRARVVILGQDPYHGPGQAIGCCFAVHNDLIPKPPSLINFFKEIEADVGMKVVFQKSELSGWREQGVLLLNTVLTVRMGQAHSHKDRGWETFTDRVIGLLNEREAPLIFILWGAPARKKKALITKPQHRILESAHPSPLSAYNGFFGSKPFSRANQILQSWGQAPIDWEVTG
ncbi:uracil-DNA glycosylase [bacterium]|nr:uracil-DNA glycosylase [bacterium]